MAKNQWEHFRDAEQSQPLIEKEQDNGRSGNARRLPMGLTRTVVVVVAASATLLGAGFLASSLVDHSVSKTTEICTTSACVLAAAQIINSRSANYKVMDPCDDFHAYMCESWDEKHDFRDDQSSIGVLNIIRDENEVLLHHLIEAPLNKDATSVEKANYNKIRGLYDACMNETAIKETGLDPIMRIIHKLETLLIGGSVEAIASDEGLTAALNYLMSLGIEPLVDLSIEADSKDPDINTLYVGPPGSFGLPTKEYYENDVIVGRYRIMLEEIKENLFPGQPSSAIGDLIAFEKKLAAASPTEEDREDITKIYNPMPLKKASELVPQIDFKHLIAERNSEYKPDVVVVTSPEYLEAIAGILKDTPKETLLAYFIWKVLQDFVSSVEDDAIVPLKKFNNALNGKAPDAKPERWRTCLREADRSLGWILSSYFVEKAFSEDAKDFGDQIIMDIKQEFIHKLKQSDWMTKDTREVAIGKVNALIQKIGFPTASPDIRDPKDIEKYYAKFDISEQSHFKNVLSYTTYELDREWTQAGKPVNKKEWGMTASTVNAYYNPTGSEIVFPAGIMQPPIFFPPPQDDRPVPAYLSYGSFGAVAGHELSHAFDSSGRHYDAAGRYSDWWDNATIAAFEKKVECFVKEYNNFTVPNPDLGKPDVHVNGKLTLGENLADAGGLSATFNAWKRREHANPGQLLPGLDGYTKEQLFFLSFGNTWCGLTRAAEQVRRVYSDPHSPNYARILGTVANSREFRSSFQCKQKEPTCELW